MYSRTRAANRILAPFTLEVRDQAWGVMDVLVDTDFPDIRLKAAITSAERQQVAQELIDFDREFAALFSDHSGQADPATFQRYFRDHGRYTAGFGVRYAPSMITAAEPAQDRAKRLRGGRAVPLRPGGAPGRREVDAARARRPGRRRVAALPVRRPRRHGTARSRRPPRGHAAAVHTGRCRRRTPSSTCGRCSSGTITSPSNNADNASKRPPACSARLSSR